MDDTYSIIRFFQEPAKDEEVIDTGLSLDEAKEHCSDDESSSSTCTNEEGEQRTEEFGEWFDGFRGESC